MTEFISSDTNVWIDFNAIDSIELPFRLDCVYLMWSEAVEDEIRSPMGLRHELLEQGLIAIDITTEEFYLADSYVEKYSNLSVYDSVALAIAKQREISIMTGDSRLRKAAKKEDVPVLGTIGILDRLLEENLISPFQFAKCIKRLTALNGSIVRLPTDELESRLFHYVQYLD